jgi:hypothetical protein
MSLSPPFSEISMRGILRCALALLATATTALGLTRLALAEGPSPVVTSFTTVVHVAPETDALALPRVVPPPQRSPVSPDHILPVSAITPKPAVDLLAAPTVPPAWLSAPTTSATPKVAVIPSGLPVAGVVKPSIAVQMVARPKIVLAPLVAAPAPIIAVAGPRIQPWTARRPPIRPWPAAHLVREDIRTQETIGVAYFETAPAPQAPVVVAHPADGK